MLDTTPRFFVFDLNFDEIIFLENSIKIVQNKNPYLTPYKIGQLSISFQSKLTSRSLSLSFFSFFFYQDLFYFLFFQTSLSLLTFKIIQSPPTFQS